MHTKYARAILFAFALIVVALIVWYANGIFLLAFAAIILAILLNSIGRGAKKITRLSYPMALIVALVFIFGLLTLIFWLYSPLIYEQFKLLMKQLPQSINILETKISDLVGKDFISQAKQHQGFFFSNQTIVTQLVSIFSTTLGSIVGFILFIILGFYIAFDPVKYVNWTIQLLPKNRQQRTLDKLHQIWNALNWWLLGKMLSMAVVGILAFIGLTILDVSLAFILALLAALLTFIPYVGAILSAIPAILIGFAEDPWKGVYVFILYLIIHVIEGCWITPYIELKTVSIPPASTVLAQLLMVTLIGGIGLALATPLLVVAIALIHTSRATLHSKD